MNRADLIQKTGIQYIFKPFYSGIGHILTFHRVSNENSYVFNNGLQVSQEYLDDVIRYFISKNIDIVTLDECYRRITEKGKFNRFVTFTFDDGYADNLTHALPVFEKYNMPFAIFLISGYPDNKVVMWWYLLEDLLLSTEQIIFSYDGREYLYKCTTMEEKRYSIGEIKSFLLNSKSQAELLLKLNLIFDNRGIDILARTKELALTWQQVRYLHNHPLVTIGAHTVNHLALSKISEGELMEEIGQSIKIIENQIGGEIEFLAYPFGTSEEVGEREFNIANELKVKMAFTTSRGNILKRHREQLHSLPRIGLSEVWRLSHLDLYVNGLLPALKNNF